MKGTIGILLAGGLSRRFGSPKAFAKIDGDYFYETAHRALESACDGVVIVTREELLPLFPESLDVITDLAAIAGKGPLAGICTAMKLRPAEDYLLLPCDMPFIGPPETLALKRLANPKANVTAVQMPNERIPLFSSWNGNFAEELEQAIINGELGVFDFLAALETVWIDAALIHPDNGKFMNINRNIIEKGRA